MAYGAQPQLGKHAIRAAKWFDQRQPSALPDLSHGCVPSLPLPLIGVAVLAHAHQSQELLLLLFRCQVLGKASGHEVLLLLLVELLDVCERRTGADGRELSRKRLLLLRGELGDPLLQLHLHLMRRELHVCRLWGL